MPLPGRAREGGGKAILTNIFPRGGTCLRWLYVRRTLIILMLKALYSDRGIYVIPWYLLHSMGVLEMGFMNFFPGKYNSWTRK